MNSWTSTPIVPLTMTLIPLSARAADDISARQTTSATRIDAAMVTYPLRSRALLQLVGAHVVAGADGARVTIEVDLEGRGGIGGVFCRRGRADVEVGRAREHRIAGAVARAALHRRGGIEIGVRESARAERLQRADGIVVVDDVVAE